MRIITLFCLLITAVFASNTKEVLLLHSYHKGYKWTDDISKSIEKKFSSYNNIELTTIYMDTKRIHTQKYLNDLASLYEEEFSYTSFDLIITSDDNAYQFAIKNQQRLFPDTPILFCGVNDFHKEDLEKYGLEDLTSGVIEQVDIKKNFELITKLQPETKNIIIINDKSNTGQNVKKELLPVMKEYESKYNIEYIDNLNIENIQKIVLNLDDSSVILFVLLFKDKTGKYFTYKQSLQKIRAVSHVPIYGLWDFYLEYGIVGGLLTSASAQGDAVSDMAIDILIHNKKPSDIPILEKSPNKYIFDNIELNRFDLDIEDVLNQYQIINLPASMYKEHTKFFIISIVSIVILSIMVLSMKANIQRRKKLEKDLSNQLKFEKVLLDTLPNAIYYKNKDGKFIGCNNAFCKLVNLRKSDIIGKTAFDFFPYDIAKRNTYIDAQILKDYSTDTSEIAINFPNHPMKYFILNKTVYANIDGSIGGIVCIMDDITERVQQKQFLIQQSKLAEMGDMVAAIAHQWNEPLVELSAQIQDIQTAAMLEELAEVNIEEFVNDSMIQIKYMSKTLTDFRNFLKPSTKKIFFSLNQSFDEILEIIGKQIFYSNIQLNINYENIEHNYFIYGYENEFKQVLLNLINNAKNKIIEKNKSNNEKGTITINISKSTRYTKIKIIDDAGKIDENIITSIFNPYFTTKKNGTGLGLYMAKVIIEDKMQGHINVHNEHDNVVFSIKLPHKTDKE